MPSTARKWFPLVLPLLLLVSACNELGIPNPFQPPPTAVITADPQSGTVVAPATITFDATDSTGDVQTYQWFVDGAPAGTGSELTYRFEAAGVYTVQLVVTGRGGEDETSLSYTVLAESAFSITLVFEEGAFTPEQQGMIRAAADRWEQLVVGAIPPNSEMPPAIRDSCLASISGVGGGVISPELGDVDLFGGLLVFIRSFYEDSSLLGRGGPCYWNGRLPNYGFVMVNDANLGSMTSTATLTQVMTHELGHILGVGPLWRMRGEDLLRPGTAHCLDSSLDPGLPRTYKGAGGVAEYLLLGGEGEPPTDPTCGHWQESRFGNEMMTPTTRLSEAATNPDPVSRMTLASLADLGYEVVMALADEYTLPVTSEAVMPAGDVYHYGEPYLVVPREP